MGRRFRFNRLEKWRVGGTGDTMSLAIPLPKSRAGLALQRCPNTDCQPRSFQLGEVDEPIRVPPEHQLLVRRQPCTARTTCPYCGHDGEDAEFIAEEDMKAMMELVQWAAMRDATDFLKGTARDFNRGMSRNSLFSMSLDVKPSHRGRPFFLREDLLRHLTCDLCQRPYGVYALALFCPDCGGRNLHVHFSRELDLVGRQLAIAEMQAPTDPELSYRLLGNAHEDVLTALETYLKTVFVFAARKRFDGGDRDSALKMRTNTFQNIDRARKRYALLDFDPFFTLDSVELESLEKNVKKRHILGHNLGQADSLYLEEGDAEAPGETVPLLADEVKEFGEVCRKVVERLESGIPELLPRTEQP